MKFKLGKDTQNYIELKVENGEVEVLNFIGKVKTNDIVSVANLLNRLNIEFDTLGIDWFEVKR